MGLKCLLWEDTSSHFLATIDKHESSDCRTSTFAEEFKFQYE